MADNSEPPHVGCYDGRNFYLPRLEDVYYQGNAAVHWTQPIAKQRTGWLNAQFHARFRELMMHTAARHHLVCPVYCLMPDHLHHIWIGLGSESYQRRAIAFLRTYLEPTLESAKFQHQAHDHVLREEERTREVFATVSGYIVENPVRAELVPTPEEWPYLGCVIPRYPKMDPREQKFWPLFWKIYRVAADVRRLCPPPEKRRPAE